ncbi:MAG: DnaA/Hda family protein, partial [SAR324 cluster bacterium]|nr:DnaA/Hda family protein [SAR324 cluster bacterium]
MDELQLLSISPKRVVIGGLEHEIYRYDLRMNHEAELRSALARFYPDKGGFRDRLIEYRMGCAAGPKQIVEQIALPLNTSAESTASTPLQLASDSENSTPPQRFQPPVVMAPAVGEFNQLACRAADAILDDPGQRFNPCTIFGKSGLGKTRLLHYLRDVLSKSHPDAALQLVSAEAFLNEFVQSLRKQRMAEFRKRYRTLDVLLVDGLQILK